MISSLKKLQKKYGAAQVCVWIGIKDTRTFSQWLSRKKVPFAYEEKVKQVIAENK